jgi:hypothetical protein
MGRAPTSSSVRRYGERVTTRGRIEMSRTGAPPTVPAARRDQAPSITGPEAALEGALGGIYGGGGHVDPASGGAPGGSHRQYGPSGRRRMDSGLNRHGIVSRQQDSSSCSGSASPPGLRSRGGRGLWARACFFQDSSRSLGRPRSGYGFVGRRDDGVLSALSNRAGGVEVKPSGKSHERCSSSRVRPRGSSPDGRAATAAGSPSYFR